MPTKLVSQTFFPLIIKIYGLTELAAQTLSTLAVANAAVSSETAAKARHIADKTDGSDIAHCTFCTIYMYFLNLNFCILP